MGNTVIKVENVSKRYRLGSYERAETFAEQLKNILISPINNFKRISQLSKFSDNDDPSIFWALKNINFEVRQGEVLGIIGHNGAGKSTLLKILSRITEPTTGQITIRGRVSALLEVGTGFHPELTGRDNIYMNGTILGMRKREIDQKFDEIVAFSGVEKHIDTPVKFYSSGMTVRLAFSVAAHLEPEILIIDEVLAVGDAEFQKKCLGKMEDVAGQGRTVLFVSHNMAAVQSLCSSALLMESGSIISRSTTEAIVQKYLSNYSANESIENIERKGSQKLCVEKVELINNLTKLPAVQSGNEILISLTLKKNVNEILEKCSFVLIVKNKNKQVIAFFHTRFHSKYYRIENETALVNCKINNCPFVPGKYFLTVRILIGGDSISSGGELSDHVEDYLSFNVEDGMFFPNCHALDANKHGDILVDHNWN